VDKTHGFLYSAQMLKLEPTYMIRGIVRKGNQLGRTLGYPTANIILHQDIPDGVYSSLVNISRCSNILQKKYQAQTIPYKNGLWLPSVTFIGAAETFGGTKKKVEAHLLDFNGHLYDKWLTVHLFQYLRGSRKFASVEQLLDAMHKDEKQTRLFFDQL
jgi:riboflavin kinase/FMN adenylyltransferase